MNQDNAPEVSQAVTGEATPLTDEDNAPAILFRQAARADLADKPRMMVRRQGEWAPVTWREYATSVERLAAFLLGQGVDQGVKVAVLSSTRLEWAVGGMAALAARGVLVPVYPSLTTDQLGYILQHSDARVLLVENETLLERARPVLAGSSVEVVVLFDPPATEQTQQASRPSLVTLAQAEAKGQEALAAEPQLIKQRLGQLRLNDVAYLLYTSGTTGRPKGVLLTHLNVGSNGAGWIEVNGPLVREGDRDLLWLPMSHIFGWGELCLGNQLGFLTYISDPLHVLADLIEIKPHVLMSVPAYWEKLALQARAEAEDEKGQIAALKRLTGGQLRFCLSGGAGLRREVKEFFLIAGMFIVEGYGLTECSPTLTMNRRDDFDFESVGKPLCNVQLKLAADGEILAKGPNVFVGYYKDPEATAATFNEDGWLCTGDVGQLTPDGFLRIIDRKKDILVTSGGKNIPPQNIEQQFKDDPLIAFLVVYGDGKKYLTALVDINEPEAQQRLAAKGEGELSSAQLRDHPQVQSWIQQAIEQVNAGLASFETIKAFRVAPEALSLENDLLTPSLKLKRAKIYRHFGSLLESMYA